MRDNAATGARGSRASLGRLATARGPVPRHKNQTGKEPVMSDPEARKPQAASNSPVEFISTDTPEARLEEGIGLCLSGDGYRAMLFHTGALWRLNQLGYL